MKLSFSTTINGHKQKAQADANQTLWEFLRA